MSQSPKYQYYCVCRPSLSYLKKQFTILHLANQYLKCCEGNEIFHFSMIYTLVMRCHTFYTLDDAVSLSSLVDSFLATPRNPGHKDRAYLLKLALNSGIRR